MGVLGVVGISFGVLSVLGMTLVCYCACRIGGESDEWTRKYFEEMEKETLDDGIELATMERLDAESLEVREE